MAALCFLSAGSGPELLADCGRIVAALPKALTAASADSSTTSGTSTPPTDASDACAVSADRPTPGSTA